MFLLALCPHIFSCSMNPATCLEVHMVENLAHPRVEGVDAELRDAQELLRRYVSLYGCPIYEGSDKHACMH